MHISVTYVTSSHFRIQVYDDDGKRGPDGKDQLIGSGFFSLRELEAAAMVKSSLPLNDGKKSKPAGYLVVRSFREHGYRGGPSAGAYGGQTSGGSNYGSYPGQAAGVGQQGGGYPGYPGQASQAGGYPGYPGSGQAQPGAGYPGPAPGAPQGAGGYPGYPGSGAPGPQGAGGYGYGGYPPQPQQGQGFPGGQGYPGSDSMFPPNNLPPGPGAGGFMRN